MEKVRKDDLKKINLMLLEMAQGNFLYRLPPSDRHDSMAAIITILNMVAEEIQEALKHQSFVNTAGNIRHTVQMHFLLDAAGNILMANPNSCNLLGHLKKDILGMSFESLLADKSRTPWAKVCKALAKKGIADGVIDLTFTSKDGLNMDCVCQLDSYREDLDGSFKTILTVVHFKKGYEPKDLRDFLKKSRTTQKIISPPVRKKPKLSFDDIRKIRKAHKTIMDNLDKELPSLKDFAHDLGTNEFKLKYGFKELYGTSVCRFHLQERLRRAKMMVEHTDRPFKSIAIKMGFKSIPHFSRAFKIAYSVPPSICRKRYLASRES